MDTTVIFLSLATIFFSGVQSIEITKFNFRNNCSYVVWPGILTSGNSPQLSTTGFELASQVTKSLDVASTWSGRIWARSFCSTSVTTGKFVCETADCGSGEIGCNGAGAIPPATLAEFTLGGYKGQDFYDVSLVDGFNLPISITPQGGFSGCSSTACGVDINAICPPELAIVQPSSGAAIGCKSACLAFNQPRLCCTGNFGSPQTCPPSTFANFFKAQCPQAYSYAYDDATSTFTCGSGASYLITICP